MVDEVDVIGGTGAEDVAVVVGGRADVDARRAQRMRGVCLRTDGLRRSEGVAIVVWRAC